MKATKIGPPRTTMIPQYISKILSNDDRFIIAIKATLMLERQFSCIWDIISINSMSVYGDKNSWMKVGQKFMAFSS